MIRALQPSIPLFYTITHAARCYERERAWRDNLQRLVIRIMLSVE